jgi:hypothetical protein
MGLRSALFDRRDIWNPRPIVADGVKLVKWEKRKMIRRKKGWLLRCWFFCVKDLRGVLADKFGAGID